MNWRLVSQAGLWLGLLIGTPNPARAGLGGCDDLTAIEPLPQVDFATEIQPIFDANCTQCHGGPNPIAFMDLTQGAQQLVDIPSFQIPQFNRIEPGLPGDSYLFLKVNCANQFEGDRMPREAPPLSLFDQALIRDWINQIVIFQTGFE